MYNLEDKISNKYDGIPFLIGLFIIIEDGELWYVGCMQLPRIFIDPDDEDGYGINYFDRYLQRK
jgi:hypothetical protein